MYSDPTGHSPWSWLKKKVINPVGNKISSGAKWVGNKASEAADYVTEKAEEVWKVTTSTTISAWNDTKSAASYVVNGAKKNASKAWTTLKNDTKAVKKWSAEQANKTKAGFEALTNSEKRKEAFDIIDTYGTEAEQRLARFSTGMAAAAGTFWEKYPHPKHLKDVQPEALLEELRQVHRGMTVKKVQEIISLSEGNSPEEKDYQDERDLVIKSLVRELKFRKQENEDIDRELERLIQLTGYKLHTMPGINLITAAGIISEIGNIERFPNSDKLARFSGVAPVNFSSAGKGKNQRSRQGNRVLNAIFHFLAIQLVQVNPNGKARHPVFREYFESKLKEGKTKPQALVCITRRAVRIIYGMMRTKTKYKPFEKLVD